MGQHQSTPPPATPKGPPPRPNSQPSARPLSQLGPQGPSYVNPENKVLPFVLPPSAKSLLRPVSQELSEYNPEYKEIFKTESVESENGHVQNGTVVNGNENYQDMNGNVPTNATNGHVPRLDNRKNDMNRNPVSMYTNGSNSNGNIKGHRRQLSASSALYSRENTIIEHPDEPKYSDDRPKKVTLPAKSTFDMPYSENLTYAQLAEYRRNQTLSDLEKKTGRKIEDLSGYAEKPSASTLERTPSTKSSKSAKSSGSGVPVMKKKTRAPPPPGQPPNPPASKSAPSTPRGTNMHTPPSRPNKPPPILKSYSVDREPPADYDEVEPKKSVSLQRSASSVSGTRKSQAPGSAGPPIVPPPPPPLNGILRNSNNRNYKSMSELPRSSSASELIKIRSPPVHQNSFNKPVQETEQDKFLSEIQKAAENRAMRRQNSEPANISAPPSIDQESKSKETLIHSAEIPIETVSSSTDVPSTNYVRQQSAKSEDNSIPLPPKTPPPVALKPNRSSSSSFERQSSFTSESSVSNSIQSSTSSGDQNAIRRLNSLLQHDIKLAAQAKATKIVKHATPVKEKPKDPAQVFREQLAKAAFERDSRAKTGPTIDEQLKATQAKEKEENEANIVFYTEQVTVKRTDSLRKQNEELERAKKDKMLAVKTENDNKTKSMENPSKEIVKKKNETPKEVFTIKKEEINEPKLPVIKNSVEKKGEFVRHPRQIIPHGVELPEDSYRSSIYASKDWTPEVDLGSDDNISDTEVMTSSLGKSNGFKSSILPAKVNEMNYKGKKQKGKERKFKKSTENDDMKKKQGSIKKFKKSVHKSVLNAFGSISKASGKVMKKTKSEDFEQCDDPPKNWTLSSSSSTPSFSGSGTPVTSRPTLDEGSLSQRAYKYMVPNGYQDHASSSESSEDESHVIIGTNGNVESNEETDNEDLDDQRYLKRAGVAYVSKSGQIVVLPEYDKVKPGDHGPDEYDNRAPKIKNKKKKFAFDATVRRKERDQINEQVSADAVQKERKREEERKREMEAELEIKRTREMEARERLQRLEMQAQLHQQMLQQQQQYGILSAPPLPPPNGFQQGYNPMEFSQLLAQQQSFGMPFGTQAGYGAPVFGNSMPNMSYDLSEYMRMMGVQNSTPTSTSQHLNSYMLSGNMNWPQPNVLSYPSKVHQDDSKRNQVFTNWTGPTKIVKSNTPDGGAIYSVNNGRNPSGSQYSADESDSSAGLSPQRTDASLSASKNRVNESDSSGYRSQISVTTVYSPGLNKSATSNSGSVTNDTDR